MVDQSQLNINLECGKQLCLGRGKKKPHLKNQGAHCLVVYQNVLFKTNEELWAEQKKPSNVTKQHFLVFLVGGGEGGGGDISHLDMTSNSFPVQSPSWSVKYLHSSGFCSSLLLLVTNPPFPPPLPTWLLSLLGLSIIKHHPLPFFSYCKSFIICSRTNTDETSFQCQQKNTHTPSSTPA